MRASTRTRTTTSMRAAALLAALPLALAACSGDDTTAPAAAPPATSTPQETEPTAEPAATASATADGGSEEPPTAAAAPGGDGSEGAVAVADLAVGDCFADVPGGLNGAEQVPVVPCDSPHANEVFAVLEQPGEQFPGAEDIQGLASEGCYASFEPYVGAPVETSALTAFPITPTAESWARGDRLVVCVLTSTGPRTSSAQGSGA